MKWDVFICHASEDKEEVALPLAKHLDEKGIKVWLDKFEIQLGDSLRQSIESGLKDSRFGVVILSEAFFAKYWAMSELSALIAREEDHIKVVLPIWHKLSKKKVKEFSPLLADKFAVNTEYGLDYVAQQIAKTVINSKERIRYLELKEQLNQEEARLKQLNMNIIREIEYVESSITDNQELNYYIGSLEDDLTVAGSSIVGRIDSIKKEMSNIQHLLLNEDISDA
jgi:hypothetical protein